MQDVSLWFLLLWLLLLHEDRAISRLTRILACICVVNASLDGVLVAVSWKPQWTGLAQISDAASTSLYILLEAFPLVLVSYALWQRKGLDSARWLLAALAFLDEMILVFRNGISLTTLAGALLLVAIVYAVYSSVREDQRRRDVLEREKKELEHESKQMRHQAEHDGLTGLWNHRVIVDRLGEEMNRSQREGTPLSVILVDVDHFKKINDTFGHLAGDLVLKEISAIFAHSLRPYDCVGRYGGEEFLVILPNCGMESARVRAEQLRVAVQAARVVDGGAVLQVTASFGVASACQSHFEAEAMIRAVDAALYRAKSAGRNCVVQAEVVQAEEAQAAMNATRCEG
jgi:diguanylate cyclase (GGDEF)-like protein